MKKKLTYTTLALVVAIAFTACTKSVTTTSYSMAAIVGSTPVLFDNSVVNVVSQPVTGVNTFVIEGLNNESNYPYIYIYVPKNDTGTYAIGGYGSSVFAAYAVDTLTIKYSGSGVVQVDSVSPKTVGAYTFTCTDGTVITGAFHAKSLN